MEAQPCQKQQHHKAPPFNPPDHRQMHLAMQQRAADGSQQSSGAIRVHVRHVRDALQIVILQQFDSRRKNHRGARDPKDSDEGRDPAKRLDCKKSERHIQQHVRDHVGSRVPIEPAPEQLA